MLHKSIESFPNCCFLFSPDFDASSCWLCCNVPPKFGQPEDQVKVRSFVEMVG
ncbi:hypothetical protein AtNW77_Chr3g0160801 [Arabidopsis thaliana]|uniref:Uncharacterized protein n=3 Tax=Arabidopsis TaxID=3701 RepID=B3H6G2_ARATH|nr:uncharacterized protein AT3G05746 [Arabidopsis thaliana]AEE74290.1 hypothetical protein AT3G05746 [Arabidopsis thaliana]KAG7624178.1 hypothetical protein ISN45_At03g005510 [Arabidopsis thaliana x Arabidopsis arenosa]VYS56431.1 unnamed protein product [Arabidopsis thaliana]|eukprot:NP_001118583.1 hypothetical protein AT3G05746 [Arabidopsis thaliana]